MPFFLLALLPSPSTQIGRTGEEIAAHYLASLQYRIDGKNVRLGRYEIDLIAFDPLENMMVFAEVKTRTHNSDSYPIRTSVDKRKRNAMRIAIARWVIAHDYEGAGRIDLLCVHKGKVVEHLKDVGSEVF